jgi:hypothetical protein
LKLHHQGDGLKPLQPSRETSRVLPPVRAFQRLMAWMQSGSVAIATNLFQEANWVSRSAIVPAEPVRISLSNANPSKPFMPLYPPIAASDPGGALKINPTAMDQVSFVESTNFVESANFVDIDAEASAMGYQFSLLERVLRWLDWALTWGESAIAQVWAWVMNKYR